MRFVSVRELRGNLADLRRSLEECGEIVLTSNGRPFAVLTGVEPDRVEEEVMVIRRARARAAVSRIRTKARTDGTDRLTPSTIDGIVSDTRRTRRTRR